MGAEEIPEVTFVRVEGKIDRILDRLDHLTTTDGDHESRIRSIESKAIDPERFQAVPVAALPALTDPDLVHPEEGNFHMPELTDTGDIADVPENERLDHDEPEPNDDVDVSGVEDGAIVDLSVDVEV